MLIFVGAILLVGLYAAITTSVTRSLAAVASVTLMVSVALFAGGQPSLGGALLWTIGGGALLFFYMIAFVVEVLPHQRGKRRIRFQAGVHLAAGAWTASLALAMLLRAEPSDGASHGRDVATLALDVATTGLGALLLLAALALLLIVRRRT